ncbi:MAG: Ldh family oxidoreductase, partial [Bacteroidetes bacterium]|nr:Ldh family oxidoreductase [Bacteroidota bacterium]
LSEFVETVFIKYGFSVEHAQLAASVLCKADIRGIDSHGVARLTGYLRLIDAKRLNPKPQFNWLTDRPSAATLDADGSIGLISAQLAMKKAIEKAKTTGVAFVGVSNSNHFGIAGAHSELAVEHGMIGWSMTNASPLVAPDGSSQRLLGTNPISVAVPNPLSERGKPFLLDMATSAAANGKLEIASREAHQIPMGWAKDKNGNSSQDPNILKSGGSLIPLGSDDEHGVHKGYGLGALVDILTGVLTGANFNTFVPPFVAFLSVADNLPGKGIGHFVGAMDISAFIEPEQFYERMKLWTNQIKSAKTIHNHAQLLIHGEPEFANESERINKGIPLYPLVGKELKELAQRLEIETQLFTHF